MRGRNRSCMSHSKKSVELGCSLPTERRVLILLAEDAAAAAAADMMVVVVVSSEGYCR
jgi:hypothetical protein